MVGYTNKKFNQIIEQNINIEEHFHNYEKWFGKAVLAVGETHVADRLGPGVLPFVLVSGNNNWGNWVQVLGSTDTPVRNGMIEFDFHRFIIIATTSTALFHIQIISGEQAGFAEKLATEDFNEFPWIAAALNVNDSGIVECLEIKNVAGQKMWMRCFCYGQDSKSVSLYEGLHEYNHVMSGL